MTTVAIMQPYFLPYLGYFKLMTSVDQFVFLDNVNYINGGWINRNRILLNHAPHDFVLPLVKASQNKLINELTIHETYRCEKYLKMLQHAYKAAPEFATVYPLLENIFSYKEFHLVNFILHAFLQIFNYLDLACNYVLASALLAKELKGQDYIIQICQLLSAARYLNPIGGQRLYSTDTFSRAGIILDFQQQENFRYQQYNESFVENLSIIDVLMFNDRNHIKALLSEKTNHSLTTIEH
jgi:hypothetical protein